nr:unnamed protein product [Callosobruchus chinensis]
MLPATDYLLSVQLLAFIPFRLMAAASANPEDWVSGSPFSHFGDADADTFTSAYLNVTVWTDRGWKSDKTEVGRYGGGYVGPAFGELVHVSSPSDSSDHSGCRPPLESSRSDRRLPAPGRPWIALVRRGRCNFEVKVENAFRARAAAVIVYNDRDSASLDKMKISNEPGSK